MKKFLIVSIFMIVLSDLMAQKDSLQTFQHSFSLGFGLQQNMLLENGMTSHYFPLSSIAIGYKYHLNDKNAFRSQIAYATHFLLGDPIKTGNVLSANIGYERKWFIKKEKIAIVSGAVLDFTKGTTTIDYTTNSAVSSHFKNKFSQVGGAAILGLEWKVKQNISISVESYWNVGLRNTDWEYKVVKDSGMVYPVITHEYYTLQDVGKSKQFVFLISPFYQIGVHYYWGRRKEK